MVEPEAAKYAYVRDDARRTIRITARGPLESADLMAIVDRQLAEKTWTYGVLYDLREIVGVASRAETRAVSEHVRAQVARYGHRGPVAIVTSAPATMAVGQTYGFFLGTRPDFRVEVFRDLVEADQWLDRRTMQG
jgi:hypothetical protein